MTRRKSFIRTAPTSDQQAEPIEFELGGVDARGNLWVETFHTPGVIPLAVMSDAIRAFEINKGGGGVQIDHIPAMIDFLTAAVLDEDRPRFSALIRSTDRFVDAEQIAEVVEFVTEGVFARPTERSSTSGDGRPPSTGGSTPGSSPPASPAMTLPPPAG